MKRYRLRLALELFWFIAGLCIWPVGVAVFIGGLTDGSWWVSLPTIITAPFLLFFSARDFDRLRVEKAWVDYFEKELRKKAKSNIWGER